LILKNQGNYRALWELAETLSDCWDSCQMNLHWWQLDRVREHSKHSVDLREQSHRASETHRADLHHHWVRTARIFQLPRFRCRRSQKTRQTARRCSSCYLSQIEGASVSGTLQ
jgi:hypothetical protein